MMSGSMLAPWASQVNPRENAKILGRGLNCPVEDSVSLLDCLEVDLQGGEGGQNVKNLPDVICERPLIIFIKYAMFHQHLSMFSKEMAQYPHSLMDCFEVDSQSGLFEVSNAIVQCSLQRPLL